jgi:hypothetical protein
MSLEYKIYESKSKPGTYEGYLTCAPDYKAYGDTENDVKRQLLNVIEDLQNLAAKKAREIFKNDFKGGNGFRFK